MNEFDEIIGPLLKREGGYVNHPNDRGGATNFGITQTTFSQWLAKRRMPDRSVATLTRAEAVMVYFEEYWQPAKCAALPPAVRAIYFDAVVNHGMGRAAKLLQKACGAEEDGVVGHGTLQAVADMRPDILAARYLIARYRFYGQIIARDKSQLVFIAGWMRRMEEFA